MEELIGWQDQDEDLKNISPLEKYGVSLTHNLTDFLNNANLSGLDIIVYKIIWS